MILLIIAFIIFNYCMDNINERLKLIIERFGENTTSFAKKIDIAQPVLYNYVVKDRQPPTNVIEKILLTYPDIDANWLITGKGAMIKEGNYTEGSFAVKAPFVSKYEIDSYISNRDDAEYIMKLPKISIIPTTRQFGHTAFEVVDDSMVDTSDGCLKPGDVVVCSPFEKDSLFNVSSGCITCLIFHKELGYMIRKAKDFNKEKRSFLAVPLNPLYSNALIFLDDIDKIFYVHQAIIRY